jgi:hypothetical protein
MTNNEIETAESTDSEDQPAVVEPFERNSPPHIFSSGGSGSGRTFGKQSRRLAEMLDADGKGAEDDSATVIIDPKANELTEIEEEEDLEDVDLESVNPLDLSNRHPDEDENQSTTRGDDS